MKRYKLIKKYPGSPILGTINGFKSGSTLKLDIVENYPEYWEEVVEKDYEILYINSPYGHTLITKETNGERFAEIFLTPEQIKNGYTIQSVKRLSDGEVFTISDKVTLCFSENYFLTSIKITDQEKIYCNGKVDISNPICSQFGRYLEDISKAKQPLFTTEDGVDIFEGGNCFPVTKDFKLQKTYCDARLDGRSEYRLYFSTEQKAEEYILMNKPCLSLNDLYSTGYCSLKGKIMDNMKDLVKRKLK